MGWSPSQWALLLLDFWRREGGRKYSSVWFDVGCLFPSSIWKDASPMDCFGFAGGFCNSLPSFKIGKWVWTENAKKFAVALLLISFVSTVADSMTRVFILVPCRYYEVLGFSYDVLAYWWFIPGAVGSYIEDCLVSAVTLFTDVPLMLSLRRVLGLRQPMS